VITVTTPIRFNTSKAGRRRIKTDGPPPMELPSGRIPRVAKLMALAIKFEKMLTDGIVADLSELARLAKVTQPRMTQIVNLNHLAPDIQEALLFLPLVEEGRDPVHERTLRPVAAMTDWTKQRKMWRRIVGQL
jgi:hypothetical protein